MNRIIVLDLDGTLLTSNNKITEYTKTIIRLLNDKGFYFILASGLNYTQILKIKNILKIKAFIISENGARVYNLDEKLIFENNFDFELAFKLCYIKFFDQDIVTQVHSTNQYGINQKHTLNEFNYLSFLQNENFTVKFKYFTNINKICFNSYINKKLRNLQEEIEKYGDSKIHIRFSTFRSLEVILKNISKGDGLKLISNLSKISLSNFVSFGNDINDQEMLNISGISYIMSNASIDLKLKSPNIPVILSNNHDGVAKCLCKMFLKDIN